MNHETIEAAIKESERFILTARVALARLEAEAKNYPSTKETAACRRASLDLTRALADMRKVS